MAEDKSIPELMKEFVEQLMLYLRERGKESVSYVLVKPLQQAGVRIALLLLVTALLILGAVFLGMFAVLGFATLFGGNLLMGYLCGGLLVLVAAAVLVLAMGRVGKEAGDDAGAKANSPSRSDGA
jgi:hypothetical protein